MPQLANLQWEKYAHFVAAGYSQTESAKRAGYEPTHAANVGSRLQKQQPSVVARIAELRENQTGISVSSKGWVVNECVHLYEICKAGEKFTDARHCLELISRLQGYLTEHRTSTSFKMTADIANFSTLELNKVLKATIGRLPLDDRKKLLAEADIVDISPEDISADEPAAQDESVTSTVEE